MNNNDYEITLYIIKPTIVQYYSNWELKEISIDTCLRPIRGQFRIEIFFCCIIQQKNISILNII